MLSRPAIFDLRPHNQRHHRGYGQTYHKTENDDVERTAFGVFMAEGEWFTCGGFHATVRTLTRRCYCTGGLRGFQLDAM